MVLNTDFTAKKMISILDLKLMTILMLNFAKMTIGMRCHPVYLSWQKTKPAIVWLLTIFKKITKYIQ